MDKVTIKIPRQLYEKIQVLIVDSGFSSPTEFIVYVLRDLIGEQLTGREVPRGENSELTNDEISAIKQRLRNLGYL
ncbi:MAG: CopG family transcriptional regulator [Myxococcales bacterium]|nr:CopG family transcriptional regulator [Myxococcales bacterium]